MNSKNPILICGGGLAGSFLAANFCLMGEKVILVDPGTPGNASSIASGLFNIVTGKYSMLTWRATELLKSLFDFFENPAFAQLGKHLHHAALYRPFPDAGQLNDFVLKADRGELAAHTRISIHPHKIALFDDPLGGYYVEPSGWLDTVPFLTELHLLLTEKFGLEIIPSKANASSLLPGKKTMQVGDKQMDFESVFFAEGISVLDNPFFNWFPIVPLKGQVLELEGEIPEWQNDLIYSAGTFLIPKGNGVYTCGSTYERDFTHPHPDEAGKLEILSRLPKRLREKLKVTGHRAGIRPSTRDRFPVAGPHPQRPDVWIINGLGAKGVLQAPWLAEQIIQKYKGKINTIPRDASLYRFVPRFFRKLVEYDP